MRTYWRADDGLWRRVWGDDGGLLCPACFTGRANRRGEFVCWRVEADRG